jgi:hypothetical protein
LRIRLIIAIGVILATFHYSKNNADAPPASLENTVYVWQRDWNDDLDHALQESADHFSDYFYLAAEASADNDSLEWAIIEPDWNAFEGTRESVPRVTCGARGG